MSDIRIVIDSYGYKLENSKTQFLLKGNRIDTETANELISKGADVVFDSTELDVYSKPIYIETLDNMIKNNTYLKMADRCVVYIQHRLDNIRINCIYENTMYKTDCLYYAKINDILIQSRIGHSTITEKYRVAYNDKTGGCDIISTRIYDIMHQQTYTY